MNTRHTLELILALALGGTAFSGTLTYRELFTASAATCPAPGAAGTLLGYPACVYGFFMFLLITGLSVWALRQMRIENRTGRRLHSAPLSH